MDLYFFPLACSLASRIVIYEIGADATFHQVDTQAGRTADGRDYRMINPKGQVPALRTSEGEVLTENTAVLQYLAERAPQSGLTPDGFERHRLQEWLSFVSSELHKHVFTPLFSRTADAAAKARAREAGAVRFAHLDEHLAGREWLIDRFSVADAYLAAVLNWAVFHKFDMARYPNVAAYHERLRGRASVARAMSEELELYRPAA